MTDISGGAWISDSTANRYKQTYLKGFLDLSYGDVTLHHGNVVLKGENRSGGSGGDLIVENGSIGIGTNTPQYTLDVTGQIAGHGDSIFYRTTASAKVARPHAVLTLENDENNATHGHGKPCLFMGWTGSDAWAFGQGGTTGVNGNTTTLGLGPGNNTTTDAYGWTPKFNFGTNGHMGIGTSAPQYMLDVRGTIGGENFLDSGTDAYIFDNSQGVMYGKQGAPNVDNDGLQLGTTGTPYERVGMSILNTVGTNSKDDYHTNHGCIQFHTHEAGDKFRTPMTIQYNGNVGIGTNAPGAHLHVYSNSTNVPTEIWIGKEGHDCAIFKHFTNTDHLSIFHDGDSNDLGLNIIKGGRVGIGTSTPNPLCTLDVIGPIRSTAVLSTSSPAHVEISTGPNLAHIDFACLNGDYDGRIICHGGSSTTKGSGLMQYSGGYHLFDNSIGILGDRYLEFGNGVTKETSSGKMGYETFSGIGSGILDIVGGGLSNYNRVVKIFDKLEVEYLSLNNTFTFSKSSGDLLISHDDATTRSVILSNTWNVLNPDNTSRGTNLELDGDIIIKPNANSSLSLYSQLSTIQLWATFHAHTDGGPRRAADIIGGFAGTDYGTSGTGTWGNEFLSFGVGNPNSGFVDTHPKTERMRITTVGVGIGTTTPTAKLHIYGGALGGNYADEITLANFEHTTSTNVSALKIITRRDVNGSDWYTASTVIRQVTDVAWQAYIIFNPPGNDYGMALGTNNGEALTISSNRNIGIGTNAPIATLHVRGDTNNMGYVSGTSGGAYSWNGSVTIPIQSSTKIIAYFEPATATNSANAYVAVDGELLAVAGVLTASDERIKKDIVDVQDASALETLRQLKPKKYKYKDVINKGEEPVWGFIAQEVRETLPYSTRLMTKTIPNIYELGSVSGDNHDIVTLTTYKTSDFSKDASANLHKTIEFFTIKDQKETAEIIEVIDEYTFKVDKDLSDWSGSVDSSGNIITETQEEIQYDTSGNEVVDASGNVVKTTKTTYPGNELFVYGQEVDDFHAIKKEAIWTIATAALQEVDRQLQTAKGTIQDQETKIQDQETKINAILLRLEKAGIAE